MKAVAFRSKVHPDGTILLPKKVRRSVKGDNRKCVMKPLTKTKGDCNDH
jgi:hypothetical protein